MKFQVVVNILLVSLPRPKKLSVHFLVGFIHAEFSVYGLRKGLSHLRKRKDPSTYTELGEKKYPHIWCQFLALSVTFRMESLHRVTLENRE